MSESTQNGQKAADYCKTKVNPGMGIHCHDNLLQCCKDACDANDNNCISTCFNNAENSCIDFGPPGSHPEPDNPHVKKNPDVKEPVNNDHSNKNSDDHEKPVHPKSKKPEKKFLETTEGKIVLAGGVILLLGVIGIVLSRILKK